MKLTFTVETGHPDGNGDIVKLDGIKIPDKVIMIRNFDTSDVVGIAEVKREGDELKATAEVPNNLLDHFPAIGFKIIKHRQEGGSRVFEETELQSVGLSDKPNTNPDIKTIREQTEGK